ncbi:hypothetical protein [Streptomyces sp. NPDC058872]|uniref:hypothetical protein n=1 Tax=Streptomyces sp. NPDC058872 TaxID=3346661 RepID=UPI0036AFC882
MFEYEIQRMNHAERVREAAARRLAHQAAVAAGTGRGLRLFGPRTADGDTGGQGCDGERGDFVRAA